MKELGSYFEMMMAWARAISSRAEIGSGYVLEEESINGTFRWVECEKGKRCTGDTQVFG